MRKIRLGSSALELSQIGLGCWQFSDGKGIPGKMWKQIPQEEVNEIVGEALFGGVNWFDTAEIYGNGRSERMLSLALQANKQSPSDIYIATKWSPIFKFASNMIPNLHDRKYFLNPYKANLLQIHFPYGCFSSIKQQAQTLGTLASTGKVDFAGVSNFGRLHIHKAYETLKKSGVRLVSNQVRYNLLNRKIEKDGTMDICRKLNISIIAYSPLAQGLLTGKFHRNPKLLNNRSLTRKILSFKTFSLYERSKPLIDTLEAIAKAYGVSAGQVSLRAILQMNSDELFVIPGASNKDQMQQNNLSMELNLKNSEVEKIEKLSSEICFR